jgi:PPOX class probable F420-dependent enzyme
MDERELQAFLDRQLTAIISTISRSGTPHSVPVWYRFGDGLFTVWTDSSRRWVRNLKSNAAVSVVVAEHNAPFAAVVARGTAEVAVGQPGTEDEIGRIVRRYLPEGEVDDYVAQWSGLQTIVRIKPLQVRSWARGF